MPRNSEPGEIIATERLTKRYGNIRAVEEVSINVKKGEIYGFLGLNGAGKTTTIRMLLGMIKPSAGTAYISGKKITPGNYRLWEQVGYLVEMPRYYPELSVYENLEMFRRMRGLADKKAVTTVMGLLQLTQYKNRKAKTMSLGNVQRIGLAKALMHKPGILILDEPTNALDPAGIAEVRRLLLDMAHNNSITIFVSSHILGEVSRLANRIGIIHQGRLLQEIETSRLERLGQKRLSIKTTDIGKTKTLLEERGYRPAVSGGAVLELTGEEAVTHPETIGALIVHAGLGLTQLHVEEEDLERYFLKTIGKNGDSVS